MWLGCFNLRLCANRLILARMLNRNKVIALGVCPLHAESLCEALNGDIKLRAVAPEYLCVKLKVLAVNRGNVAILKECCGMSVN